MQLTNTLMVHLPELINLYQLKALNNGCLAPPQASRLKELETQAKDVRLDFVNDESRRGREANNFWNVVRKEIKATKTKTDYFRVIRDMFNNMGAGDANVTNTLLLNLIEMFDGQTFKYLGGIGYSSSFLKTILTEGETADDFITALNGDIEHSDESGPTSRMESTFGVLLTSELCSNEEVFADIVVKWWGTNDYLEFFDYVIEAFDKIESGKFEESISEFNNVRNELDDFYSLILYLIQMENKNLSVDIRLLILFKLIDTALERLGQ